MARVPTAQQIEALIEARAAESQVLEFKAEPWGPKDKDKLELLKDITAFANTDGGTILIGVSEKANCADALAPISAMDAEAARSRINDLILNGVEPRLYGVTAEPISVPGGVVLAVGIPRSASRPHRVTSMGTNRYWLRTSTGAYEANVADLRRLFLQSAEFAERAALHHRGRLIAALGGDVVPTLAREPNSLVFHIVPADAFSPPNLIDARAVLAIEPSLRPFRAPGYGSRPTADGYLVYRGGPECHGYTLVQRNGIVEAVRMGVTRSKRLPVRAVEASLAIPAYRHCVGLQRLGVEPPYYVYSTLSGVGGMQLAVTEYESSDDDRIVRNILELPPAVVEDISTPEAVGTAFKAAFDTIWNAGGYMESDSFKSGRWVAGATE